MAKFAKIIDFQVYIMKKYFRKPWKICKLHVKMCILVDGDLR